MSGKYIVGSLLGTLPLVYVVDHVISDKKIFGGTTPGTVSNKEWWEATDKKFQAWPRTAGPPSGDEPNQPSEFHRQVPC